MSSVKSKNIFVANRLPYSLNNKTGEVVRGSGGLVSALLGAHLEQQTLWMGIETDVDVAQKIHEKVREQESTLECLGVVVEQNLYNKYYDGFCNDTLWPLFHYESQLVEFERESWDAYVEVNSQMAEEILKVASEDDLIWIHDFHFFVLPAILRKKNPKLKIGFFLHIPFPSAEIFRQLPTRKEIMLGLAACDLVGFHDYSYLRHFSVCLKAQLGIESSLFRAEMGERFLTFGVYPIGVDTENLRHKAFSPEIDELLKKYEETKKQTFLFLGVDRLDYIKGVDLKLKGFYRALEKYPEMRKQVSLLQLAVPTRASVPAYQNLKRRVDQLVGMINGEHSAPNYTPVHYLYQSVGEEELLSLYRLADGLLVTSKRDGMNLVCLVYTLSKYESDPGVVVLSECAGAATLLNEALIINPWDSESIADAIWQAFQMKVQERQERFRSLLQTVSDYSANKWAANFLGDLSGVVRRQNFMLAPILPLNTRYWPSEFKHELREERMRLMIDYDGTLVPLNKDPKKALISQETLKMLRSLQLHFEICIISGRPKEFLESQFLGETFHLAAEHGAYYKKPQGSWTSLVVSDLKSWYGDTEKIMGDYEKRVPMSFIEHKNASLTWHYRGGPEGFSEFQARKLSEELEVCLANQPCSIISGVKVIEARAVECNKGDFLRWLSKNTEDLRNICLGDDRTDEDMFKAARKKGWSFKVGSGCTQANLRLASQTDVLSFLKVLNDFMLMEKNVIATGG